MALRTDTKTLAGTGGSVVLGTAASGAPTLRTTDGATAVGPVVTLSDAQRKQLVEFLQQPHLMRPYRPS